jgi:hypothetical protein
MVSLREQLNNLAEIKVMKGSSLSAEEE